MTHGSDLSSPEPDTLGYCPNCSVPIPTELLLIEYEREHGRSCYAECPACEDVVRPFGSGGRI